MRETCWRLLEAERLGAATERKVVRPDRRVQANQNYRRGCDDVDRTLNGIYRGGRYVGTMLSELPRAHGRWSFGQRLTSKGQCSHSAHLRLRKQPGLVQDMGQHGGSSQ